MTKTTIVKVVRKSGEALYCLAHPNAILMQAIDGPRKYTRGCDACLYDMCGPINWDWTRTSDYETSKISLVPPPPRRCTQYIHPYPTKSGTRYAVAQWDQEKGQYYRPFDRGEAKATGCSGEFARRPSGVQNFRSRRKALRRARYLFYELDKEYNNYIKASMTGAELFNAFIAQSANTDEIAKMSRKTLIRHITEIRRTNPDNIQLTDEQIAKAIHEFAELCKPR